MKRRYVDWYKTGKSLQLLRSDNINLRRNVCRTLNLDKGECDGKCGTCRFDMDSSISRTELAQVFYVTESVIVNWESGRTPVAVEDLLFYCEITGKSLDEILIFEEE